MLPLPLRILIVDDHNMFRQALASLLKSRPDVVTLVGEAADSCRALELARELRPDVVLLDVLMPGCGGTEIVRQLRSVLPQSKLIMLSASSEYEHIREAIVAGADGYLTKSLSAKKLFDLLQEAASGKVVITADVAAELFEQIARSAQPEPGAEAVPERLDELDDAICRMVADGATNAEIAKALGISPHTVRSHLSQIMRALGLENRTQLAVYIKAHRS